MTRRPPSARPATYFTPRTTAPGSRTPPRSRRWSTPCARATISSSRASRPPAPRPPTPIRSRASPKPSTRWRRSASRACAPYIAVGALFARGRAELTDTTIDIAPAAAAFVEKAPLERYVAPKKPSLVGMTRAELGDALGRLGVPEGQRKMRVQQLWHWIYFRGFTSFDAMTSVSKDLRALLSDHYTLDRPEVVAEQVSVDGTRKWLMRLPGDPDSKLPHEIETVYIPDTERGTLCVSSQVGCTLNCSFCHTGTQRLVRNLTAGEIVGQVLAARDKLGDWPGGTRPTDGVVP